MPAVDLLVRARRTILPDGERPASVLVHAGRIVAVNPPDTVVEAGEVVEVGTAAPAGVAGLAGKGRIAPGCDADLVAFAPDEEFVVDPAGLHHRHPVTPYAGRRLVGRVRATWVRGRRAGGAPPAGRLLSRGAT